MVDEAPGPAAFVRDGDGLRPHSSTESGWAPNTLMGRYLAGLVAWGAEPLGDPDLQPARLTVDMFRPAPMGLTRVVPVVVRSGRRIRVVDVEVVIDDVVVCRGTVVFLRRGEDPPGPEWSPAAWTPPSPEGLTPLVGRTGGPLPWDQRPIGTWGALTGERGIWFRETVAFVAGEALTPFLRVALAVDNTNGVINASPAGLAFINADLTLTLAALPVDDWLGMRAVSRVMADGVSTGVVDLYDSRRRIGQVSMIALSDLRQYGARPVPEPS